MSSWPSVAATTPSSPAGHGAGDERPWRCRLMHLVRIVTALLALCVITAGCAGGLPRDSQGTLDRVTGGVLRVGISEHPPFATVGADGQVGGEEAELVREYAASIDAEIDWVPGPESALAEAMKAGELDVVIGGFTEDSPFTGDMAFTRPYTTLERPDGSTAKVVMGVRPGENALMVDLELFLARTTGEI